jgi:hypothetical protein
MRRLREGVLGRLAVSRLLLVRCARGPASATHSPALTAARARRDTLSRAAPSRSALAGLRPPGPISPPNRIALKHDENRRQGKRRSGPPRPARRPLARQAFHGWDCLTVARCEERALRQPGQVGSWRSGVPGGGYFTCPGCRFYELPCIVDSRPGRGGCSTTSREGGDHPVPVTEVVMTALWTTLLALATAIVVARPAPLEANCATTTTTTSTTTTTLRPCGYSRQSGTCGGRCAPGTNCGQTGLSECGCVPEGTTPCWDSSPSCGGSCPSGSGEICQTIADSESGTMLCACVQQSSTCGLQCPGVGFCPGGPCAYWECVCLCGTYPQCGGSCPQGTSCSSSFGGCLCLPS